MEFSRLATFERTADGLLSETDILDLEIALIEQPEAGALIPGGRGLRKLRRPARGRGKRGGARVIYYYVSTAHHIYFVFAYAKNEREDLTPKQIQQLANLL
jgi:hypothetical protein